MFCAVALPVRFLGADQRKPPVSTVFVHNGWVSLTQHLFDTSDVRLDFIDPLKHPSGEPDCKIEYGCGNPYPEHEEEKPGEKIEEDAGTGEFGDIYGHQKEKGPESKDFQDPHKLFLHCMNQRAPQSIYHGGSPS